MDAVVFVVDSADDRLSMCSSELGQLLDEPQLRGLPFLVFANKEDLDAAQTPQFIAEALNLYAIRDRPWQIQGCSALKKTGLDNGINWLVKNIK